MIDTQSHSFLQHFFWTLGASLSRVAWMGFCVETKNKPKQAIWAPTKSCYTLDFRVSPSQVCEYVQYLKLWWGILLTSQVVTQSLKTWKVGLYVLYSTKSVKTKLVFYFTYATLICIFCSYIWYVQFVSTVLTIVKRKKKQFRLLVVLYWCIFKDVCHTVWSSNYQFEVVSYGTAMRALSPFMQKGQFSQQVRWPSAVIWCDCHYIQGKMVPNVT